MRSERKPLGAGDAAGAEQASTTKSETNSPSPDDQPSEVTLPNLDWALIYARAGFAVVPVWWIDPDTGHCACAKGEHCDRPGKHPVAVHGVKNATTDPIRIRALWQEAPNANVALATGELSQCIVIDVDTADGKAGDVALTEATAPRGGVPRTLRARSSSGGAHYFYRWRKTKFTRKVGFLRHVDYLADGGYCIVQPSSRGEGKEYRWATCDVRMPNDVAKLRGEMGELPDWFDDLQGTGRRGTKGERKQRRSGANINAAALLFKRDDPAWQAELGRALSHVDPDSRDLWVLFGIILGRIFERNDAGFQIYEEWSARSAKFSDAGTSAAMRDYYYNESQKEPTQGEPATIGTIFFHAREGGWEFDARLGVDGNEQVIVYQPGRARDHAEEVARLLQIEREAGNDAKHGRIYAYGDKLAQIIQEHNHTSVYKRSDAEQQAVPVAGWVLRVSSLNEMLFGNRVTATVRMARASAKGSVTPVECPRELSCELLAHHRKRFPPLRGIVQWPMVVDGCVLPREDDEPYNLDLGLFFELPAGIELSGLDGTEASAKDGWALLRTEVLGDFPFADDGGRSEAAALALLLTFVQRRMLAIAPAFLITAPIPGSGKTWFAQVASVLVHGRALSANKFVGEGEEARKAITAALLDGPGALLFDNLQAGRAFDSVDLAIAMTSDEWSDRILGETRKVTLPNRTVWVFTGNNVWLSGDLPRRFVTVRMEPATAANYERKFRRPDLITWAARPEVRALALRALINVLMWGAKQNVQLGHESGFPAWDSAVRKPVVAVTGIDPVLSAAQRQEIGDDEEDEAVADRKAFCAAWADAFGDDEAGMGEFHQHLAQTERSTDSARRERAQAAIVAVCRLLEKKEVDRLPAQNAMGYAAKAVLGAPVAFGEVTVRLQVAREGNRSKRSGRRYRLERGAALREEFSLDF